MSETHKVKFVFDNEDFVKDFQTWLQENVELLFTEFEKKYPITNYMGWEVADE